MFNKKKPLSREEDVIRREVGRRIFDEDYIEMDRVYRELDRLFEEFMTSEKREKVMSRKREQRQIH